MTAKRKTAKRAAAAAAKRSKANWSADEHPQHCGKCGSTNTTVTDTKPFFHPPRTVRYRVCDDCGQKFTRVSAEKYPMT